MKYFSIRKAKKVRHPFSPAQITTLTFAALVLLGAGILSLPISSRTNQSCGFLTALFTSCSSVCVTGLSLVDTYTQWSGFGQAIILLLIQVGGLGFMTIFSMFLLMLREKIDLKNRMLLQYSYSLNDIQGVIRFLRRVVRLTVVVEFLGAVILTIRFSQDFPIGNALWMGVFHSISAFCNAGFDILGTIRPGSSLMYYSNDWVVCGVAMALITIGGIGFFVWDDLWVHRRNLRKISVYSKLVLIISAILVFGGALFFGGLEWNNPMTLGPMTTSEKILCALFQSITTRTAGFSTISQSSLTQGSQAISCIWMLIGGSSGSTAGGMKTVTVGVLLLSAISNSRGKSQLTIMKRKVNHSQISLATSIVTMMVSLALVGALVLTIFDHVDFLRALYETTSALGTVGLTADVTPVLSVFSQSLIIIFMFFGRVGITTISMGFLLGDRSEEYFHYAETKLLIG